MSEITNNAMNELAALSHSLYQDYQDLLKLYKDHQSMFESYKNIKIYEIEKIKHQSDEMTKCNVELMKRIDELTERNRLMVNELERKKL